MLMGDAIMHDGSPLASPARTVPSADAIERRVRTDLVPQVAREARDALRSGDIDLLALLDSMQLLRLVVVVESAYGIKIDNSDLIVENLGSPFRLAAFIAAKTAALH
jgi:acyl carrier protein